MTSSLIKSIDDIAPFLKDEDRCLELFARWRWPHGFTCPSTSCGSRKAYRLRLRPVWQCAACRRQVRLTSGTVLHGTRLPLRHWLYAIWMVAHRKQSISALQLQKELALGSYETAWFLLHKIRKAILVDPDGWLPLGVVAEVGVLHLDERLVRKQNLRGADDDHVIIAMGAGEPQIGIEASRFRIRTCGAQPRSLEAAELEMTYIEDESEDFGLPPFPDGPNRHDTQRTRRVLGNLRAWLEGTFHGVTRKYLAAYVAEFRHRFVFRGHDESCLATTLGETVMGQTHVSRRALRAAYG